jgi:phosphate transport system substrate-binding protein
VKWHPFPTPSTGVACVALAVAGGLVPLVMAGPAAAASNSGTPSAPGASASTAPNVAPPSPTVNPILPAPSKSPVVSGSSPSTTVPTTTGTITATTAGTITPSAVAPQPRASSSLIGSGSSFAGPEVLQWTTDTAKPPYLLTVDYTPSSSGQGRFDFGNKTVDFAVSDIPYQGLAFDTAQPTFKFMYVPVTAGGLAFMYNLPGLPSGTTLQLSSYSICALMTGGVAKWNDPIIQADNPGVALPNAAIRPVIRSDLAGTNFVLQEYCIHEQPALWKAFIDSPVTVQFPNQVADLSDNQPRSDWPQFAGAISAAGSSNAADDVSSPHSDGYITAVETAYAIQRNVPVASVKNANGAYTQPSAVNVASALAYATQNSDGTHTLNFDGAGPHVYNPSTYSYLLTPTTGWSAAKGATLSQFANYSLTLGQQKAPEIGYASLGLSLEQYGVNAIKAAVPGAVALTASEQGAYQCGDLTPAEVQAGQTQPTCGVTNPNNSTTPGTAASTGTSTALKATGKTGTSSTGPSGTTQASTSGQGGSGGSGTGAGVNPGVSLSASPNLPTTGGNVAPVVIPGLVFVTAGWLVRRRLRARMQ